MTDANKNRPGGAASGRQDKEERDAGVESERRKDKALKDAEENVLTPEERAGRSSEEVNAQCTDAAIAGANAHLHDVTSGHVFGDNTSSSAGANNPGQHGRDGGELNGEDNNPAPEPPPVEEGPEGPAGDEAGTPTDLDMPKKLDGDKDEKEPVKKL